MKIELEFSGDEVREMLKEAVAKRFPDAFKNPEISFPAYSDNKIVVEEGEPPDETPEESKPDVD